MQKELKNEWQCSNLVSIPAYLFLGTRLPRISPPKYENAEIEQVQDCQGLATNSWTQYDKVVLKPPVHCKMPSQQTSLALWWLDYLPRSALPTTSTCGMKTSFAQAVLSGTTCTRWPPPQPCKGAVTRHYQTLTLKTGVGLHCASLSLPQLNSAQSMRPSRTAETQKGEKLDFLGQRLETYNQNIR